MRLTGNAARTLAGLARSCSLDSNEMVAILAIAQRAADRGDLNDDDPPIRARDIHFATGIVRRDWQKQGG